MGNLCSRRRAANTAPERLPALRTFECEARWFDAIRAGEKTVEGRKGTPKWAGIEAGDLVVFYRRGSTRHVFARVTAVRRYNATVSRASARQILGDYLASETLLATLPGVESIDAGVEVYRQFWSDADVEKYGVIAIQIAVCH
jgi:ASC-1-like (ASCH) protein